MGNTQAGTNDVVHHSQSAPTQHTQHTHNGHVTSSPAVPTVESRGMPVPGRRSDRLEQELCSSLSGISGLSAHRAFRTPCGSLDGGGDFISPGQYITRLRANSVSVEPEPPQTFPTITADLPAVVKWDKGGTVVSISGSFNRWERKLPLVKSESNFYTIIDLQEGEHEYKYCVDGEWRINPDEPTVTDCEGNINNVLRVKKSDFEIIDALECDSVSVQSKADSAEYPQADYGQETPTRRLTDRHIGPPVLPQHLLQVILNKDVSQHLEPGLLPEPNHVMLNHLYALSIKDGVMVLSDTSRFRKKCVTTLLYKPID